MFIKCQLHTECVWPHSNRWTPRSGSLLAAEKPYPFLACVVRVAQTVGFTLVWTADLQQKHCTAVAADAVPKPVRPLYCSCVCWLCFKSSLGWSCCSVNLGKKLLNSSQAWVRCVRTLQHLFLYFLWKAPGKVCWQMLEPFVLGMKNGRAISIRALQELLFWRRESMRAVCSSPQG